MAKTHKSKPKSSIFLCCFGCNFSDMESINHHHRLPKPEKAKINHRWFSWRKPTSSATTKTVPFDASMPDHKHRVETVRKSKSTKSKSTPQKPSLLIDSPPSAATNPPPPAQTPSLVPVTPNPTLPKTRHKHKPQQNHDVSNLGIRSRSHRVASPEDDTRRQSISSRAIPTSKRHVGRLSSMSVPTQTTSNQPIRLESANKRYDSMVGMSVVLVTLVVMIFCGRFCAIFFTSAWLYFIPRFRATAGVNDITNDLSTYSVNSDLDSKVYKKKVILEGLLERNHRGGTL